MSARAVELVYLDSSVLADRYLPAAISEAVDDLLETAGRSFAISELCTLELESALTRQHREKRLSAKRLGELRARFEDDLRRDFFELHALSSAIVKGARSLIAQARAPLNSLDSIHLRTALDLEADALATNDRQLARAASIYGIRTITVD